jgi:cell division septation protein DedD
MKWNRVLLTLLTVGAVLLPGASAGAAEQELAVDATVLILRRSDLRQLGILSPVPEMNPWGSSFAANITDEMGRSVLQRNVEVLHSLRLRAPAGKVTQVRIGSSTPVNGQSRPDYEYLDAGLEIEFAHRTASSPQGLPVTLAARFQIRNGNSAGGLARTIFTTHPIQYEARVPEGSVVIVGGFLSEMDARLLTGINGATASPLLKHLQESERKNENEIVLMLAMPRGVEDEPEGTAPATPVVPERPSVELEVPAPIPPPPQPPEPAAVPVVPGVYTIQVGAFGNRAAAQGLLRDLSARYSELSIQAVPGDKPLFRVRVGSFATREAAAATVNQLRADGFAPFVTAIN